MERSARRLLRASKNAKRKIRHLLSFHAFPPSRDVSTVAEENFRVFWKGVEAKARVGEKRGGCASYLALEAGLVGEALEADLVERIGRVAAGRDGAWRLVGASTREIRARDRCREKVASTERRRWILPPQNRRDVRARSRRRERETHLMSSRRKISLLE